MATSWTASRESIGEQRVTEALEERVTEGGLNRITEGIDWDRREAITTTWTNRTEP